MRRSFIPLALLFATFATPALSQSANLANPAALRASGRDAYVIGPPRQIDLFATDG